MSDLIINLGTKEFLLPYITNHSIFAYNIQYQSDYLLLQFQKTSPLSNSSKWRWQSGFYKLEKVSEFFLSYLNLSEDNQKLLISQADKLTTQASLYQRDNKQQLLLLSTKPDILDNCASILHLTVNQLNPAQVHYHIADTHSN